MDTVQFYTEFFTRFLTKYNQRFPSKAIQAKPSHKNWMKIGSPGYPLGAGYHLSFTNDGRFRVEVTFQSPDRALNKFMYDVLLRHREDIERELGERLEWERKDEAKRAQISMYYRQSANAEMTNSREEQFLEWAVPSAERFQAVINSFLMTHGQISPPR